MATIEDFDLLDIRTGTIISAEPFPKARRPAYKLTIDFGDEIGIKRSSAQITDLYDIDGLIGRQVMAVVNFPPRQIADFMSEVLTLGVKTEGGVALIVPDMKVPNGLRLC